MKERTKIVENNPVTFCHELQRLVQEGFVIDDSEEFSMIFNLYTIGMKKATIEKDKQMNRPAKDK